MYIVSCYNIIPKYFDSMCAWEVKCMHDGRSDDHGYGLESIDTA